VARKYLTDKRIAYKEKTVCGKVETVSEIVNFEKPDLIKHKYRRSYRFGDCRNQLWSGNEVRR